MDFFDPRKKRAHITRLYLGYVLMGVVLIIGTLVIWYQTYGFDIDRQTGAVIQKGLIFVDAHPQPANILLNGVNKGQTDARLTPAAGRYTLELKRAGYRSWRQEFELYGGAIERFVYPFLFPEKLTISEKKTYVTAPPLASVSLDRHWLVIQHPGSFTTFDIVDLTDPEAPVEQIGLPTGLLSSPTEASRLEAVEWAANNRHLLIKHVNGDFYEYVVLDRDAPAQSVNVSRTMNSPTGQFSLRDKKFDQLYLYGPEAKTLQTADLKSGAVQPLLTNILAYKTHGSNTLLYVTDTGASAGKARVRIHDGDKEYTLKDLPAGGAYVLALTQFSGKWYVAAGLVSEGKVSIYRDPVGTLRKAPAKKVLPISTLRVGNPEALEFSTNARFLMAQGGSKFAVYDAERDKQYRYDTSVALTAGQKAAWMDGHRLSLVSDNKVVAFDFDGTNRQTLSPASPAYRVFFDRDYEAIYTFAPTQSGTTALTRTELIVK